MAVTGLGQSMAIGLLPAWITAIADGDGEPLDDLVDRLGYSQDTRDDSDPVFDLIGCAAQVAHSILAGVDPAAVPQALHIDTGDAVAASQAGTVAATLGRCALWDATPAATRETQPVANDVPALVLTGALDPQTPSRPPPA